VGNRWALIAMCDRCQDTGRVTYEVRARIDFAEVLEHGAVCAVRDYKSSYAAPPYDEVARKRRDGSLAAKSFQLILYALCLAYGVPVREEECSQCGGDGGVDTTPWCPMTSHVTCA
jgi:hypothetical protein